MKICSVRALVIILTICLHSALVSAQPAASSLSSSNAALSFGAQPIGGSSVAQVLTVTNNSTLALALSPISIAGANSSDFSHTNNCPISPSTLAAGASCQINVVFSPIAAGPRKSAVSLTDGSGD